MILKQTFKNHFLALDFVLVTTLVFFCAWWYFDYDPDFLLVIGLFHLIFSLPALYLHFEYSIKNFGQIVEITANEVIIKQNGLERKYNYQDLTKIILYKSANLDKGIPILPVDYYYYCRVITKQGEDIIMTCLMCRKPDKVMQHFLGVPFERKKRLFCTIHWE